MVSCCNTKPLNDDQNLTDDLFSSIGTIVKRNAFLENENRELKLKCQAQKYEIQRFKKLILKKLYSVDDCKVEDNDDSGILECHVATVCTFTLSLHHT